MLDCSLAMDRLKLDSLLDTSLLSCSDLCTHGRHLDVNRVNERRSQGLNILRRSWFVHKRKPSQNFLQIEKIPWLGRCGLASKSGKTRFSQWPDCTFAMDWLTASRTLHFLPVLTSTFVKKTPMSRTFWLWWSRAPLFDCCMGKEVKVSNFLTSFDLATVESHAAIYLRSQRSHF